MFLRLARALAAGAAALLLATPAQSSTLIAIDAPGGTSLRNFAVSGWAIDFGSSTGPGIDAVHVWVYPASGPPLWVGAASYGGARADVGAAFGQQFTDSGYWLLASLPPGDYTLVVYARAVATNQFTAVAAALTVGGDSALEMHIDYPVSDPNNPPTVMAPFRIWGWAIDCGSAAGTGVDLFHVWAVPAAGGAAQFLGVTTTWPRPDVAAIYGPMFMNAGFMMDGLNTMTLPSGTWDLVVYAHSTVTNTFSGWRVVRVNVINLF